MTAAVMLVQNNQNNQKIWSPHISHTILKVRFFWDTLYIKVRAPTASRSCSTLKRTGYGHHVQSCEHLFAVHTNASSVIHYIREPVKNVLAEFVR